MMLMSRKSPSSGVGFDLLDVVERGTRIAANRRLAAGQDSATIRRELLDRMRAEFPPEECDSLGVDLGTLLAAVRRGLEAVLVG